VTVSFSATVAVTPARSRATGCPARRTSASFTPAAASADATAASLTSTEGGEPSRSSMP
jgi:hypothetical protein